MIIVITGLTLKSPFHWPRFAWHAFRSFTQAKRAEGCLKADARAVGGVQHTLTVWRDGAAMKRYANGGAHGRAQKIFHKIASGKVAIFTAEEIPDWPEALKIWQRDAREV